MSKNDQLDNLDIAVSDSLLGLGGAPSIVVTNPPTICNTEPVVGCKLTTKTVCK